MTESTSETQLAAGLSNIDRRASTAGFVAHQLGRAIPGTVPIRSGTVDIGPNGDVRSAHLDLNIAAIATGIAKRDLDLAKPRLLDTARFPTLTVDVGPTPVSGQSTSEQTWQASASLGLRGISFTVNLEIAVVARKPNGDVQILVTTAFDRTPIGIKAPNFVIGKKVEVSVDATFTPATGPAHS